MQELKSYAIGATDGEAGKVVDIFFDDQSWVVRYLVVHAVSRLSSRKVLISPYAVQRADWNNKSAAGDGAIATGPVAALASDPFSASIWMTPIPPP